MKPFTVLAGVIFALIALAHLYRLTSGLEVIVGGMVMPQWISALGLVVASGLAVMLWQESRR